MSDHFSREQYNYMLGIVSTYLSAKFDIIACCDDPINVLVGQNSVDIARAFRIYSEILKFLADDTYEEGVK